MKNYSLPVLVLMVLISFQACNSGQNENDESKQQNTDSSSVKKTIGDSLLENYTSFSLKADLSNYSANQKKILRKLILASKEMDAVFWKQSWGDRSELMDMIETEPLKKYAEINYGPWDRLNGNAPFINGIGPKPAGANFYPEDMTKEEFEKADLEHKKSLYTLLRRDGDGNLETIWYHQAYKQEHEKAAKLLREAADLSNNEAFKLYLNKRAEALLTSEYQPSDMAWLDMKDNQIDVVIGPIENYEDRLFGHKAAHEAYVLLKDTAWSAKLEKYAAFLPRLQENLPVGDDYKKETPGRDAELNAYDVIYYAGDCNAGSKTIAINLPNDEEVQLKKGTRRLQLKNAMRAKFDKILIPIADELIADEQRDYISFDAFFANTMFHEVAHGLGIKNTINNKVTVREALEEQFSALEEGKADILGLYMITKLHEWGELEGNLNEFYVTFMASIFRSVRFGASSAHGKANMLRFNYFKDNDAFTRNPNGKYKVNFDKLIEAMNSLTEKILTLQGDGDKKAVEELMAEMGNIGPSLDADLSRLNDAGIPIDIVFEQGLSELNLAKAGS